eukprot:2255758-Pyramimonas_sp.AAC.2
MDRVTTAGKSKLHDLARQHHLQVQLPGNDTSRRLEEEAEQLMEGQDERLILPTCANHNMVQRIAALSGSCRSLQFSHIPEVCLVPHRNILYFVVVWCEQE